MGLACEIVLYGGPLSRRTVSVDTDDSVYRGELDRKTCLYAVDWDSRRGMYIGDTAPSVTTELDRLRAVNAELLEALQLAQTWLANSVPTAAIDGPTPLPVIAAAIAKATEVAP